MKKSGGAIQVKAHIRRGRKVRAYTRMSSGGRSTKPSVLAKSQKKTMDGMTKEGKLAFLRAEAERATERMMRH